MEKEMTEEKKQKRRKRLKKTLIWIAALWATLLVVLQLALSPAVLTRIAGNFASEYIDGNVTFGKVSVSVLKNLPNLSISFDSVSVTYPSERFARQERSGAMRKIAGRGNGADTLMSFRRFSASLNIAALGIGQIRIPSLILEKPRIFAREYGNGAANWKILDTSGEQNDTEESGMPSIMLGKISFKGRPVVTYENIPDSTDIILDMKAMLFNGRVGTKKMDRKHIGLSIDSLFLAGRFPSDTFALHLDKFRIGASKGRLVAGAEATTYIATESYGRLKLPLKVSSDIEIPKDTVPAVYLRKFRADIAGIPFHAEADIRLASADSIHIKGNASVNNCKVGEVLKYINRNIWEEAGKIQTDAQFSVAASCEGYYVLSSGKLPSIEASVSVPASNISHKDLGIRNTVKMEASLKGKQSGPITFTLSDFSVSGKAVKAEASGKISDMAGADPLFDFRTRTEISLDTLSRFMKGNAKTDLHGEIAASLGGKIRLSQMNPYKFADADLSGFVKSGRLGLTSAKDSAELHIDSLDIWLGATENKETDLSSGSQRMLSLSASLNSARIQYKKAFAFRGRKIALLAQNSADILDTSVKAAFYPFTGKMDIGFMSLVGSDTTMIMLADSRNTFTVTPKKENTDIPVLSMESDNGGIFLRGPVNRLGLKNITVKGTAAMNSIERRKKAKAFADSLASMYPDIPRDSLFAHWRHSVVKSRREIPEWLTEKDFVKQDLQLNIDSSLIKVFREWDAEGSLALDTANIITPYFPLRNRVAGIKGRFDNNEIVLETMEMDSGTSHLSAGGKITGIRRTLLHKAPLRIEMQMNADSLNMNELLAAYSIGSGFKPSEKAMISGEMPEMEDSLYEQTFVTDTLANVTVPETSLIVVPSNIDADIRLSASDVKYAGVHISEMTGDIAVRERCVQFLNTSAKSDIGSIGFEGFYSTRTKKNIKTGFDFSMDKVYAEKIIALMPAIDTVMPMLKSFKGELNCEMAATASLDTNMNVVMPSINGVVRITGNELSLQDSEAFRTIAKKLKFKDRHNGFIDNMSVEGVLKDNRLEVFPFVLQIDRYTLAMSGIQNLDTSFKYHISVIDSPIPFRLGVDIHGNFEDFKFKIGKAKYKNTAIPVFSAVVDETRFNLKESIEKIFTVGVEKAVIENEKMKSIEEYKKRISYVQAAESRLDSLSNAEKAELQ